MDLDFNVALNPAQEAEVIESPQAAPKELPLTPPPPPPVKLEIRPVALTLAPYLDVCRSFLEVAQALEVTDEASYKTATSHAASNKKLIKNLETARKSFGDPCRHHVNAINSLFNELTNLLKQADRVCRDKMERFLHLQKLERQRREAEQREEQRRLQERLDAEARAQREQAAQIIADAQAKLQEEEDPQARATLERTIEEESAVLETPAPVVPPVAHEKPTATRTTAGTSYAKEKWICKIVQPELVPREYCEPSQKLLDDAVKKGGIRHIPGCEITEETKVNIRT
jgi:hypothetical protein